MNEEELLKKLDELKRKIESSSRERDDLKRQLHDAIGYRPSHHRTPTEAEILRENIIEVWKNIERQERHYRVIVQGLEAKRKSFDDQLYYFETL